MNLFRKINRSFYNAMMHSAVIRVYDHGIINSKQMHEILGRWNRECYPEWHEYKGRGVVQQNCNTAGGDIAGRDINK